jgi:hypothetical protein
MYLTQSNVIRGLSKQEYTMLREMCQYSNNLYNVAVYTIRQHYFETRQFLRYEKNYPMFARKMKIIAYCKRVSLNRY